MLCRQIQRRATHLEWQGQTALEAATSLACLCCCCRSTPGTYHQVCALSWQQQTGKRTHLSQGVGRADICFAYAPGWQHSIEVIVIAGHNMVGAVGKHLRPGDVNAVGIQRQRIVRQRPGKQHKGAGKLILLLFRDPREPLCNLVINLVTACTFCTGMSK